MSPDGDTAPVRCGRRGRHQPTGATVETPPGTAAPTREDARERATSIRYLGLSDQVVSAASNIVVSILAAHDNSRAAFGKLAICMIIVNLSVNVARARWLEPMLVLSGAQRLPPGAYQHICRQIVGTAALGSCAFAVVGVALGEPVFVVLAIGFPVFLVQDFCRFRAFVHRAPGTALLLDVTWLIVVLVGIPIMQAHRLTGVADWLAVWGIGALVSVCLRPPRLGGSSQSWPDRRPFTVLGWQMTLDNVAADGALQATMLFVPAASSVSQLGVLRLSQVAAGPVNTVMSALSAVSIGDISRHHASGQHPAVRRLTASVTLLGVAAGVGAALVFALVPEHVGSIVLGRQWHFARVPAIFIALSAAFSSVSRAATMTLRATGHAGRSMRLRLWAVVPAAVAILAGAHLGGALGASVGYAVVSLVLAGAYLLALRTALAAR